MELQAMPNPELTMSGQLRCNSLLEASFFNAESLS